jgi:hypothetical protein
MSLHYTPEEKNRLEIDKIDAEVKELRSWVRRWLGSLGGILGIVTAAVSVLVAVDQWDKASRALDVDRRKLEFERKEVEAAKAELRQEKAEKLEKASSERLALAEKKEEETVYKIAAAETTLRETTDQLEKKKTELEEAKKSLENVSGNREVAEKSLVQTKAEYAALQKEFAALVERVSKATGPQQVGPEVKARAANAAQKVKVDEERRQLVDDNTKARLFLFVVDEQQSAKAWNLKDPLREQYNLYLANVLVASGKREVTPVVRFFRTSDQAEATRISDALAALGLPKPRVSYVIDPDSVGTGRKYQIWLRSENLR